MFEKTTLPNGLRVVTTTLPHSYSASVVVQFGAGSRYETTGDAGGFHYLEHLLFKGTDRRPYARQISEEIERVGGYMNASTHREMTDYWIKVSAPHFPVALDLLMDMLLHSRLDPNEVEKERNVVLEELASTNDHPDARMEQLLDELCWPGHAMGRDVGGTADSIRAISRERLAELVRKQYVPNNAVLSVASNRSHHEVVNAALAYMEDWEPGAPLPWFPVHQESEGPNVKVEFRKSDQAHLSLAVRGLPSMHPDRHALDLLSVVLGEGMSSRLFQELREQRALVYDAHSYAAHYRDTGTLVLYSSMVPKNAMTSLEVMVNELGRMREQVPESELNKAKELAKGRLMLRIEDTRALSGWAGMHELLEGNIPTVEDVGARIDAVTADDVQRVADSLLRPENLRLAVVGPFRSEARFQRLLRL